MKLLLGLDLGVASIGWCLYGCNEEPLYDDNGVIRLNANGEVLKYLAPTHIVDLGSFVFDQLQDEKKDKQKIKKDAKNVWLDVKEEEKLDVARICKNCLKTISKSILLMMLLTIRK